MRVPPEVLDEIRARVDLVDLVGAVVPLKRAGERWKGLCPFHQEKTPSFTVNPKLNLFHCFGCHAGGDAFEFLRRHDRLEFPEAVRLLAERAGVPLPGREATPEAGARDGLLALMEWAARRFEAWLWDATDAERARRYLEERGIERETARAFRLGYAPEGWDHLLGAARREGIRSRRSSAAGLVLPRQNASRPLRPLPRPAHLPDRGHAGPRHRVRGPRAGRRGAEVPELPRDAALPEGPDALRPPPGARAHEPTTRRALLVEGYVDCLMAHQHGFGEAVAVLGHRAHAPSARAPAPLRRRGRSSSSTPTGRAQEAARRAEDLLERSADPQWWALTRRPDTLARRGLRLRVATLPAGHDPDTFLRAEGAARPSRPPAGPPGRSSSSRSTACSPRRTRASPRGRATGSARVALMLSKVQDGDEAIELGREAARRLGVDPSDLWLQAQRLGEASPPGRPARPRAAAAPAT